MTIQLLAATTFVSEVDSPTLALMAPLLSRGLAEKLTSTVRKVAVIIVRIIHTPSRSSLRLLRTMMTTG
jgi:hypothetical protein